MADNTFVVTGYWELMQLAHDPRISSDISRSPVRAQPPSDGESATGSEDLEAYGHDRSIIVSDPPEHDRARRQVMRHFGPPHSPEVIPGMEPDIVRLCNELLDEVKASGQKRLDIVDDYAYPVPVAVICKILGVPVKDEPMFHAWIFDFLAGVDLGPEASSEEGQTRAEKGRNSSAELLQYLSALIEQYRREPGEGLLSNLVNDDGPDVPMSAKEAVANAQLLLIAGHDSTVNTITNCVMTLLRDPGSIELLRARPELIPRAIEEVQRLQSAVQFFPSRSVTDDIEIGDTVIPKGAAVHLVYSAANRDPKRFANPTSSTPNGRTTSISVGAAASTPAWAGRWLVWRSTSRWRPSCAAWRIRGWSSTRRRIGAARSSGGRDTCSSTSTESSKAAPLRRFNSSHGKSRASFARCRSPNRDRVRCW